MSDHSGSITAGEPAMPLEVLSSSRVCAICEDARATTVLIVIAFHQTPACARCVGRLRAREWVWRELPKQPAAAG
jgi:hypothetical protein